MTTQELLSPSPLTHRMSLYKLKSINWKDLYRDRCRARIHHGRDQIIEKFRKISITDDVVEDNCVDEDQIDYESIMNEEWQKLQVEHSNDLFMSNSEYENLNEQMKREMIEEKLYWDGKSTKQDRKRSAKVQLILENQNGILCFHCKQFVLEQSETGELLCQRCGSKFNTNVPIENIKQNMKNIIGNHTLCCLNQFPNFVIFKSKLVIVCDFCNLFKNIFSF